VAHTEKIYGPNPSEKTIWINCNIWGERGEKLKPYILKGTYIVVEGSGGVNAYTMKSGEAAAIINCRVSSLEFGGKPTGEAAPVSTTKPVGGVTFEGVDGDLPF
jgi:single-stranded DNA-binding protein